MWWLISLVVVVALLLGASYFWARQRATAGEEPAGLSRMPRIWQLVEAMALVGVVFVLAGGGIAAGERWQYLSDWGHVTVFAVAAALFLIMALRMQRFDLPALDRLTSAAWLFCLGCVAAAVAIAVHDVYGHGGPVTTLATGLVISAGSIGLWLTFRHEWQMGALFAGLTITLCGAILTVTGTAPPWLAVALGLWALGVGWTILGNWYPDPLWTTVPLGTALGLLSPAFVVWDHGWVFAIGMLTAAAAMAASVPLKNGLLLTAGTVTLAGYLIAAVARYYRVLFGLPGTLAIAGVLVLALAVLTARIWHNTRPPDDELKDLISQLPQRPITRPPVPRRPAPLPPAPLPPAPLPPAPRHPVPRSPVPRQPVSRPPVPRTS